MLQDRALIVLHCLRAGVRFEIVSDRRAGILPKHNAMSKRKFHEEEMHAPQSIHSFSTALIPLRIFQQIVFASRGISSPTELMS
jgi:hypothetical protein